MVLTAEESQNLQAFSTFPVTDQIKVIQLGNLATSQVNGILSFNFPILNQNITFKANAVEYESSNKFYWYGKRTNINDSSEIEDIFHISAFDSIISGEIILGTQQYLILPISSRYQFLIKSNNISNSNNTCDTNNGGSPSGNNEACMMGTDACTIRLLVMFTPDLVSISKNGIVGIANLGVSQLKTALKRSNIKHIVKLVGVEQLDDVFPRLTSASEEVPKLRELMLNNFSDAHITQSNFNADMFILLTEGGWDDDYGCSYAKANNKTESIAIVGYKNAIDGIYTFTHEARHIMGRRHEDDDDDLPARAHSFYSPLFEKTLYTVMHTKNHDLILNFSNPNINYTGVPTGLVDYNNACIIQENGCALSNVYSTDDLCNFVSITNPLTPCNPTSISFFITGSTPVSGINCNSSNNTYEFEFSSDGINYFTQCNGSASFCQPPVSCFDKIFVKVTIKHPGLGIIGKVYQVVLNTCLCITSTTKSSQTHKDKETKLIENIKIEDNQVLLDNRFYIFPNPSSNQITVYGNSEYSEVINFDILTIDGKRVKFLNKYIPSGKISEQIDISKLDSGIYTIRIYSNHVSLTSKFIKI